MKVVVGQGNTPVPITAPPLMYGDKQNMLHDIMLLQLPGNPQTRHVNLPTCVSDQASPMWVQSRETIGWSRENVYHSRWYVIVISPVRKSLDYRQIFWLRVSALSSITKVPIWRPDTGFTFTFYKSESSNSVNWKLRNSCGIFFFKCKIICTSVSVFVICNFIYFLKRKSLSQYLSFLLFYCISEVETLSLQVMDPVLKAPMIVGKI